MAEEKKGDADTTIFCQTMFFVFLWVTRSIRNKTQREWKVFNYRSLLFRIPVCLQILQYTFITHNRLHHLMTPFKRSCHLWFHHAKRWVKSGQLMYMESPSCFQHHCPHWLCDETKSKQFGLSPPDEIQKQSIQSRWILWRKSVHNLLWRQHVKIVVFDLFLRPCWWSDGCFWNE